jgi:hypothetical protein
MDKRVRGRQEVEGFRLEAAGKDKIKKQKI